MSKKWAVLGVLFLVPLFWLRAEDKKKLESRSLSEIERSRTRDAGSGRRASPTSPATASCADSPNRDSQLNVDNRIWIDGKEYAYDWSWESIYTPSGYYGPRGDFRIRELIQISSISFRFVLNNGVGSLYEARGATVTFTWQFRNDNSVTYIGSPRTTTFLVEPCGATTCYVSLSIPREDLATILGGVPASSMSGYRDVALIGEFCAVKGSAHWGQKFTQLIWGGHLSRGGVVESTAGGVFHGTRPDNFWRGFSVSP